MSAHPRAPRRYFVRATTREGWPCWRLRLPDMIVDMRAPKRGRRVTRSERKRVAAEYVHDFNIWAGSSGRVIPLTK